MSGTLNKVMLIGNLGRDPESRTLGDNGKVTQLSIATSEKWRDKTTGEAREKTEWHRMTAFGKLAEIIGQYLKKGSKAYFEGKLRTNEYEKDGILPGFLKIIPGFLKIIPGCSKLRGFQNVLRNPSKHKKRERATTSFG